MDCTTRLHSWLLFDFSQGSACWGGEKGPISPRTHPCPPAQTSPRWLCEVGGGRGGCSQSLPTRRFNFPCPSISPAALGETGSGAM